MAAHTGPSASNDFKYNVLLLSGNGVNGAQNNTFLSKNDVATNSPGGYSVYFDGAGDYVDPSLSATTLSTSWTMECWFNASAGGVVFDGRPVNTNGFYVNLSVSDSTQLNLYYSATNNLITISGGTLNRWIHAAVVKNGSNLSLYVNGVSVYSVTDNNTWLIPASRPRIGANGGFYSAAPGVLTGYISNLRIVNGTALYTSNFTVPSAPLASVSGTLLLTCQSSTIIDNSGNNVTLTVTGNANVASADNSGLVITRNGNTTQGTFSPFSLAEGQWSNYFDGSGDYLSVPDNDAFEFGTGDFTIECWVNFNSTSSVQTLVGHYLNSTTGWGFQWRSDNGRWSFGNGDTQLITYANTPTIGRWYHYCVCRSGTTLRMFLDGTQVSSVTNSTNIAGSTNTLTIGALNGTGIGSGILQYTNGYLSNVRIVKGTALYTSNFTPSTTPLTAISGTSLLTCQSNRFKDNSSNNFAITVNGDTKVTAFSPFEPGAPYIPSINGGSAYFDGNGDDLNIADNTAFEFGSGEFSVECFVYVNAAGVVQVFVEKNGGTYPTGYEWVLYANSDNSIGFNTYTTTLVSTASSANVLTVGQWYHLVGCRSGTTQSLFVNGARIATTTNSGTIQATTSTLSIGRSRESTFTRYVNGYISNIRIVKGTSAYNAASSTITPPTAPLTAITNTSLLLNCTNAGIIDNAGKNDIETVGNAQVSTSVKKYGTGSMAFDGTGDWLSLSASNNFYFGTGDFTVEFWLNTSYGNQAIVDQWLNGSGNFITGQWQIGMDISTRYLNFYVATGASAFSSFSTSSAPASGQWVHVAFVRSSNVVKCYIDGTANANTLSFSGVVGVANSKASIGVQTNNSTLPFQGYIDDLRITKGLARYTSNFDPPSYPLKLR